jgi:hypothetical protein
MTDAASGPLVGRLYLVADSGEIARRRPLVTAGRLVEAWPDLYARGEFWMGESAKALLDGAGTPLPAKLELDAAAVPVYYGPRLCDIDSLPAEESLQTRVLSAHGIAAAWITLDRFGERTQYEPKSPADPVFYLRRPGGSAAHVWRLFQSRREASVYMGEYFGADPEARPWAEGIAAGTWDEMIERHATHR